MNKLFIGNIADIDVRGSRKVMVEGTEVAVFRLSDGSIRALENRCPHKNGKLSEGMVCGHVVHCPLHDWKIDTKSGQVLEPDYGCVPVYQTEVDPETGHIYIWQEQQEGADCNEDVRKIG